MKETESSTVMDWQVRVNEVTNKCVLLKEKEKWIPGEKKGYFGRSLQGRTIFAEL